jgi:hypothetical protein
MRRGKHSHFQGLYIRLIRELVPVVVVFTKSDLAFPHISGLESGNYQYRDRTRTRAYTQCNELCRSLFRRDSRDVPAELVSGDYFYSLRNDPWTSPLFVVIPQYSTLINNLTVTTDRFIMGSRTAPSSRSSLQGVKSRIAPAPLTWSVALRASQDISIQASIEYVVCLLTLISFICFVSQDWTKP